MGHLLGIGLDVLSLCRVERLVGNKKYHDRFLQRILSPFELELFHHLPVSAQHERVLFLASRFSAKEAAYKALYPFMQLTWKDLRLYKVGDRPMLEIENAEMKQKLQESCQFDSLMLSITHDAGIVAAVVLATGRQA